MLHAAGQYGHTEVVRIAIDDYKLDPNARTKVCGQTCRCLAKSSRASGGLCDGRWHVIDLYEHGRHWDRFIEWWQLDIDSMLMSPDWSCHSALSTMNLCTYVVWTSVFLAPLCLHFGLVSHAVFPEDGHDTCDASSRQRSHRCCRHACAQVQLFIDWCHQSKCICVVSHL